MGHDDRSIKNVVGRTEKDPWNAVLGRRPSKYQIPQVGHSLIEQIDRALFERNLERAIRIAVIFERWARWSQHFYTKAPAVMASVYTIADLREIAERQLEQAKRRVHKHDCDDCAAFLYQRTGVHLIYNRRAQEAVRAYDKAVNLYECLGDSFRAAKSLMGRGVAKAIARQMKEGLADEERAIDLIGPEGGIYLVMGSINVSAILANLGRSDDALARIEYTLGLMKGLKNTKRAKLLLRWIRALLLEKKGERMDLKLAGQMLDRIAVQMKKNDMKSELRVLLADRARIARDPATIIRIAKRAYDLEDSPDIMEKITAVIRDPTPENIVEWRNALDSYVPPFPASA